MKNVTLVFVVLLINIGLIAQVGINEDNSDPHSSAMLEVKSTDKGLLPPRMTQNERDAITSPAEGLIVWCNNCGIHGEMQVYNGTEWTNLAGGTAELAPPVVGDFYEGGVVFYIFQSGDPGYVEGETHGFIAASADQSTFIGWSNGSYITTGASGTALGTGISNTIAIIAAQGATTTDYAAGVASEYNGGSYDDWFLPSLDELNKLYLNKDVVGGFASTYYWSSSEITYDRAWLQAFNTGAQLNSQKNNMRRVRAVRTF